MAKLPWMKFYPATWMSDPALRACRPETRGVWMDLCSTLWLRGAGELCMTAEQIGRICGTSRIETLRALLDLHVTGTADIDPAPRTIAPSRKTEFKIANRRIVKTMAAMIEERERWSERTDKKRALAKNVTLLSRTDSDETPPLEVRSKKLDGEEKTLSPARVISPTPEWGKARFSAVWVEVVQKTPTGNWPLLDAMAERVSRSAASRKVTDIEAHGKRLLQSFVAVVDGWRDGNRPRPQKSVEAFDRHFAAAEEVIDGERDPKQRPQVDGRNRSSIEPQQREYEDLDEIMRRTTGKP